MSESQGEQYTSKELYEQANRAAEAGNSLDALNLYEQAGYSHKAIKIAEELGDVQRAYDIAMKANDHFTSDKLAVTHDITTHEYFNFPPAVGEDIRGKMRIALKSRLKEGATAARLGFSGFRDKMVADVGARDGRFVPLFRELGATDVYGIDPDVSELERAVEAGLLDRDHAIPRTLEDIPPELKGKFDIASIFNFNIPITERQRFIQSLHEALSPTGQVVMTVAERDVLRDTLPVMQQHFDTRTTRLWDGNDDTPHAYLVVANKRLPVNS